MEEDTVRESVNGAEWLASLALAALGTLLCWLFVGCSTPGDAGWRPWQGPTPIEPPGWTNRAPEAGKSVNTEAQRTQRRGENTKARRAQRL